MDVSFAQVNEVIRKLPVGYYVGRNIPVEMDATSPASSYDILNDKIYISYNQLTMTISQIEDVNDVKTLESYIRTNFYHELSHALLTPRQLKPSPHMNIFEDERIERKLDGFYYDVDFHKMVEMLNDKDAEPTENIEAFFDLVRFRKGPEEFLKRVEDLLTEYSDLNSNSEAQKSWWSYGRINSYADDVDQLYRDFCDYRGQDSDNSDSDNSSSQDQDSQDEASDSDSCVESEGGLDTSQSFSDACQDRTSEGDNIDESGVPGRGTRPNDMTPHKRSELVKEFESITQEYYNEKIINELTRIFRNASKTAKMNSSAVNSYSGVFDPRSAGREDYKFFVQKNRNGSARAFSKVHLNLFLDRSGSFYDNVHIANELIHSLCKMERVDPNFSFTLITCGNGERIEPKKNIMFSASGGNDLDEEIWKIFKDVQQRQSVNYNIVLFDGFATWGDGDKNFGAFNTPNTLIISDPDNEEAIANYAPGARSVITKNYTEELIDNLIKMLGTLVK